jgi:HEPN domain-containing protein
MKLTQEQIEKRIRYWQKSSEHDYETMLGLFSIKRYSDCLFFGHIVIEKILKAIYVKNQGEDAPYIHDLSRIAKMSSLVITEDEINFLDLINDFNIRTRYPDFKLDFYKKCTLAFTKKHIDKIKLLYEKLCQELK